MNDRELMQQALEVLERCPALYKAPEAATALRERLAQPEQDAVRAERQACAELARQWDVEHPDTNYGKCIAGHIEMRSA